MRPPALRRAFGPLLRFALQASLWAVLALVIAAMFVLAGAMTWAEAIRFSAVNWLPWALLTPGVFWLSRQFPLERGHLTTSIPVHFAAGTVCTAILLSVSSAFTPLPLVRGPIGPGGFETRGGHSGPDGPPMRRTFRGGPSEFGHDPLRDDGPGRPGPRMPPPDEPAGIFSANRFRGTPNFSLLALALRANVGFAIYLIVATGAHALTFYRRAQQRDREALALAAGLNQAKLDALRLQLQPHFLFNTLNAISTLVHRDASAADELIGDLSELLRLSLQTTAHEVPLARELELLDRYLAIEQARLGDRLRLVRDIDPNVTGAFVPTLLLQPLAENAVRHGIEPRVAPGTLTVRARRAGDRLHLILADDGVGLPATGAGAARRGIGLTNTEERLRALHGTAARLELFAPPEGGTRVEITLPFKSAPAPNQA